MVKCVMIQLCRCLFGLSYLALYVLLCYQLFGWVATLIIVSVQLTLQRIKKQCKPATLIIVSVQLFLAGWLIWAMIRAPD